MEAVELGRPRLHLRRTGSTNARAVELARAGAPHGTLVTAAEQTAGRGRQGRRWTAPAGRALLCSLVLRDPPPLVTLAAALAVADVVAARGAASVTVKWPNDVLLDGGKVAGILVEGRPQERWAVLGIGLNVALEPGDFPDELRATAATLGGTAADVEPSLATLLDRLAARLAEAPAATLTALRARDALRGRPIRWAAGEGTAAGIDDAGHLVVARPDGTRVTLDSGEVHLGRLPHP